MFKDFFLIDENVFGTACSFRVGFYHLVLANDGYG